MPSTKWTMLLTVAFVALSHNVQAQGSSNCTRFDWDQRPLYIVDDRPRRVSAAEVCPQSAQNKTCLVTAEGDEQFSSRWNVTKLSTFVPGTSMNPFVESINAAVGPGLSTAGLSTTHFNSSVIAAVDQTRTIAPGRAAYLNFTALLFCFTGTTGDCTGPIANGTPIEVCAPLWRQTSKSARRTVDGEYSLVYVDARDAANFTDPYSGQSSGGEVGDEGSAGVIRANSRLWPLVVILAIALF